MSQNFYRIYIEFLQNFIECLKNVIDVLYHLYIISQNVDRISISCPYTSYRIAYVLTKHNIIRIQISIECHRISVEFLYDFIGLVQDFYSVCRFLQNTCRISVEFLQMFIECLQNIHGIIYNNHRCSSNTIQKTQIIIRILLDNSTDIPYNSLNIIRTINRHSMQVSEQSYNNRHAFSINLRFVFEQAKCNICRMLYFFKYKNNAVYSANGIGSPSSYIVQFGIILIARTCCFVSVKENVINPKDFQL